MRWRYAKPGIASILVEGAPRHGDPKTPPRHCEERSDAAIQSYKLGKSWIASSQGLLAMTGRGLSSNPHAGLRQRPHQRSNSGSRPRGVIRITAITTMP